MKRNALLKLTLIGIFTVLILMSCEKDDKEIADSNSGSLSCKIYGVTYTASSFNTTLIGDASAKRLDIRVENESETQLIITVNDVEPLGTNFSHLGDTVYVDAFENTPLGIVTLGTIMYPDGSFLVTSGDGVESGYSILTSCDLSNKTVSGLFEFMFIDFLTDDTVHVTEGEFSNLSFSAL